MEELLKLEEHLFNQKFNPDKEENTLDECKQIAKTYALVENSIAVLSDLHRNKSYIFNGSVVADFNLNATSFYSEIDSIWEDDIYNLIHPDDLKERHILELQFFHLLKNTPVGKRTDYRTNSVIRMLNRKNKYVYMLHRTFYLKSQNNGSVWIALCLYNYINSPNTPLRYEGFIQNYATGEITPYNKECINSILTDREKELLKLIESGYSSKEIALKLSISKNTVDRHRQNIMAKLRVRNCTEAIRIARSHHYLG
ncbi:MAG: response regulator transcription factor [Bacteroidales bacterium]